MQCNYKATAGRKPGSKSIRDSTSAFWILAFFPIFINHSLFSDHRYNLINDPVKEDNIVILSEPDIVAMKLNAISTSGQRIKDFIDIYFLIDKYDLKTMLSFYCGKYNQKNDLLVLKSLIYFDDVEESEWPVMIREPDLKLKDVKRKIQKRVLDFTRQATREK